MLPYQAPIDDMLFLLFEVYQAQQQWQEQGLALSADEAEAVLREAARQQQELFAPLLRQGDQGCVWQQGRVQTPEGFVAAYRQWAEAGWLGLAGEPNYGGAGMPKLLSLFVDEMQHAANSALALYPLLSAGAALLLLHHGSEQQKQLLLPKLYSGQWAGTMCLTEPHAGSDLGLLRSKAEPEAEHYLLSGSKIFITGGEQDLTENIIHLVLARLPDAPPGVKGISLFMVPKVLFDAEGQLQQANGVHCASLEHKMGIKGSSTAVLHFDQAKAWLVGEPHQGLAQMFTMMNYERLTIGLQGLGLAERALQIAKSYAQDRRQGRRPGGVLEPEQPADPLTALPDVRRMLLDVQVMVEGGRALATYCGLWLDRAKSGDALAQGRVALLTPVVKAYLTDQGFQACVTAQQVLGGHGYVSEWGIEQLVRDARIAQIYEGTNGIQALDLLGRKVVANGGQWLKAWLEEARTLCWQGPEGARLAKTLDRIEEATDFVLTTERDQALLINAVAVDFLHLLALGVQGQQWLLIQRRIANRAEEFQHKQLMALYFEQRLLIQDRWLLERILSGHGLITQASL